MTTEELLGDARALDLGPQQMAECRTAHETYPEGFARICEATLGARNPSAALMKKIKTGAHKTGSPSDSIDLAGCTDMAQRLYQARIRKYPTIDEKGWTLDDAIAYAVDTATYQHSRFASADVERELRIRIGHPWTRDQDPSRGTGCPPDLLANILLKVARIGVPPARAQPIIDDEDIDFSETRSLA